MNILTHPAHLITGSNHVIVPYLIEALQQSLCTKNKCGVCATCLTIRDKQHHALLWLQPEKKYTLESIEPIFKQIAFQLGHDEQFFFIIEQAEELSPTCQNALLKSVEEPPHGYHFIFCASAKEVLLPTLVSRCMQTSLETEHATAHLEVLRDCFLINQDPQQFLEVLGDIEITDSQIELLIEMLFTCIMQKQASMKKGTQEFERLSAYYTLLQQSLEQLPMPGSSKIFLKNLFLQMIR